MAAGKKSFVLYSDLIHTIEKMPDDKAGQLFKHILAYVNDLNPVANDLIIELTFEPIKQQLKRDLQRWEKEIKPKRSESGRLGGIKSGEARRSKTKQNEANASNAKQNEANEAVNVNVNDIILKDFGSDFLDVVLRWLEYKSSRGEKYKTEKTTMVMVKKLFEMADGKIENANEIVTRSIANNYSGLFPLKETKAKQVELNWKGEPV